MHALGVDIGGTKIAAGVVDENGAILAQVRRPTDPTDAPSIDRAIAAAYHELAAEHEIGAIGLAAAGFCSPDRRSVAFGPNIAAWRDYPLAERVAELTDPSIPVVVENDANAAGWAEYRYGVGAGTNDFLMLTVGTGLGGAAVVNGELVRGAYGVATEVGHMRVVPDGRLCGCGHFGCWEQYASGSALVRTARAALVAHPDRAVRLRELAEGGELVGPHVTAAAQEGDALAIELFAELGRWLGEGAATVTAFMDPSVIAIGGGVGDAGDLLLLPTQAAYESVLPARTHRSRLATIAIATLGNDAGMVGAADLARH
ncbi:ROK family glucokinase [Sanguibacter sp. HDW7]|uniref:ROK family glucokinase n=1 Tax=Sanguibacter sp. HDW7 TaxID=2714931 RepID=UPI00140E938D|nr:ROK family glucokinase [Sanguibacter sp. HDW7]QIK83700.1 ROK family glucokinase [Sanguibacter sp. HDW7]